MNRKGHVLLCPERGPTSLVTSTNVTFGTRCPRSSRLYVEILPRSAADIAFVERPALMALSDLATAFDARIIGTYDGDFVISGSGIETGRVLPCAGLVDFLAAAQEQGYI